jgi:hypothetical protein
MKYYKLVMGTSQFRAISIGFGNLMSALVLYYKVFVGTSFVEE